MKKRIMSLVLVLAMALSMSACGGKSETKETAAATEAAAAEATEAAQGEAPAAGEDGCPALTTTEPIKIILVHNSASDSAGGKIAEHFKEEVETRSNGVISMKIYANGESGTGPENLLALKEGTVQMMYNVPSALIDPSLGYMDLPCMAPDNEAFRQLFGRGTVMRQITEDQCSNIGLKLLTLNASGFGIISSNKEVRCFEDFAGVKMRTSQNPVQMELFKSWGCSATPVDFGELYVALQQGLVEAQNNPIDGTVSAGLHEVQKYIINTNHIVIPIGLLVNADVYNSYPEDVKALLNWICENEIEPYTDQMVSEAEQEAIQIAKDAGLEFIDFTEEDWNKMREASKPVYDMVAEQVGQDIIDTLNEQIAALGE